MQTRFRVGRFAALAFIVTGAWAAPLAAQQSRADLFQAGRSGRSFSWCASRRRPPKGRASSSMSMANTPMASRPGTSSSGRGRRSRASKAHFQAWPNHQFPVEGYKLHHEEDLAVFRADLSALNKSAAEILRFIPLDQLGSSEGLDPGDELHSMGHSTVGGMDLARRRHQVRPGRGEEASSSSFPVRKATPEAPCSTRLAARGHDDRRGAPLLPGPAHRADPQDRPGLEAGHQPAPAASLARPTSHHPARSPWP